MYPTPELLLILDFETTGINVNRDEVIELGAILYSVSHRTTLAQLSTLVPISGENSAEKINRISANASRLLDTSDVHDLMSVFERWLERADYLVAHNAKFDRQWLGTQYVPIRDKHWLCTYEDFSWPHNDKKTSLVNTALNHGVGVSSAHRALIDCQLIAALFDRIENFPDLLQKSVRKSFEVQYRLLARVSYANRDLAKQHHYRWDAETKEWFITVPEECLETALWAENESCPFEVIVGRKIPASNQI